MLENTPVFTINCKLNSSLPVRVLHVVGSMNRGGAEVMLMDVTRNKSSNFHFDFLVNYNTKQGITEGDFDQELVELGCRLYHIGAQWDIGPIKYLYIFKQLFKANGGYDVVHIHMNAKSGIIAWAAKRAGAKKIVVHSHADLKIRGQWLKVFLSKIELKFQQMLMARFATNYWGCSEEANRSLFFSSLLTPERSAIINNAVDVQKFQSPDPQKLNTLRRELNLNESTLVLGNVGRVVRHKNVRFIIDILKELKKREIEFRFIYAGRDDDKAYQKEILAAAKDGDVIDCVHYLGSRDDVETVVNAMTVFVGPALQEGFGLVAVEAQAAGIPCVLYSGFPPSVDMELGLVKYHSDFDVEPWVDSIIEAKKHSDLDIVRRNIVNLGFDVAGNTAKIEELYLQK